MTMVMAIAFSVSALITHRWTERQSVRSAVYHVQTHLRLARIQAIARRQTCRFLIDENSRRVSVLDVNDPADPDDDLELARMVLSRFVKFERPDPGDPITLTSLGGGKYQASFSERGLVADGAGEVTLMSADGLYFRVRLLRAGGVTLERWNGSKWVAEI